MQITLDQARALDALEVHKTLQQAAKSMNKTHTAVLYALRQLEEQTELNLMDRSGYRLALTPAGERVLEQCRRLLQAERDVYDTCEEIKLGWEPTLRVVMDGVLDAAPVLRVVGELATARAPTRVQVFAEYLGGVEESFQRHRADVMLSILPPQTHTLVARKLPSLRMQLVAHKRHPLARKRGPLLDQDLVDHVLLTVHGGDPRLALPTAQLDLRSTVHLNDFHAKHAAILAGIGFGWLPDHLCANDVAHNRLRVLEFHRGSEHVLSPRIYLPAGRKPGRAMSQLLDAVTRESRARSSSRRAASARRVR